MGVLISVRKYAINIAVKLGGEKMIKDGSLRIKEIIYVNHIFTKPGVTHEKYNIVNVNHCQLLYKLSGVATITFGKKTVHERADDLRFTPNPADFDFTPTYFADISEPCESINIAFTTAIPLSKEITVKRYASSANFKRLFQKMQKLWYYKHSGYYCSCMSILYEIFAEIQKAESNYISQKMFQQILPAIEYIDNHFTDPEIDILSLASLCGISRTYMTRLFNACFSMPPNQYIISKKMEYACDLLKTRQYKIQEIAEKVGYSNSFYFSRAFKKHKGVPPSAF